MSSPLPVAEWMPPEDRDPASLIYTFGGAPPVLSVQPGTLLRTWSLDCYGNAVRSTSQLASEARDPRYINPQTGPFHIEGAEPGDTLAVHFVSIVPKYDYAVSATAPFFGALTGTGFTALLHPALPERTWIYDIEVADRTTGAGIARFRALDSDFSVELPLDPMHGTVGVAPPGFEVRSALTPGSWGGNMDTPEIRAGVTCYLGVNVEGALFSFGDGHARQGEGETCGVAVESAMDTVVIVDLLKGVPTPWPRLESDDCLMTTGSTRPLEDAFRISQQQMVHWVAELTGLSELDAYQLASQVVLSPAGNVVDTTYTMLAKFPKAVLGGTEAMGGMHARMRARAAQWRQS